jgi:hypothetical protein
LHLHVAKEIDGRSQKRPTVVETPHRAVPLSETEVATRHERPHPELFGTADDVPIGGLHLLRIRGRSDNGIDFGLKE